ncbi:MAG: N-6 DNA methylase [bacterium]|nr:N-6 DNA methylase [bacterium]
MTDYSDMNSWKSIRQNYLYSSYIAFLVVTLNDIEKSLESIKESALENGLEDIEILNFLFNLPGVNSLVNDIIEIVKHTEKYDVNEIYQEYLSVDYMIENNRIVFAGGKNSRDILGSYYTQEDFAYEVVKKSIDDYLTFSEKNTEELRVVDFSCGGGAFLVAAYQYCMEKNIKTVLYGVDVDPIAIMITRARLVSCCKNRGNLINIRLGNPLLCENEKIDILEVFKTASEGKFYNYKMGISILEKFDIVVGNPPWEKIRFEEKKFLQHYVVNEKIESKLDRTNLLKNITQENREFYTSILTDYDLAKKHIKKNLYFKNTNCGELNTYALFTEFSINMLSEKGISGLIVKSSLVKMPVYSEFMKSITERQYLYELYMFTNRKKIFYIDSREEFSVIYLRINNEDTMKLALDLDEYAGFYDKQKIVLPYETINLINPDTGMIPNIKNNEELQFLIDVYNSNKIFGDVYEECKFGRLVHLTNHSNHIITHRESGYAPIYEGKFIELYTAKYATFNGMTETEKYKSKATARQIEDIEGQEYPEARYYIEEEIWRKISKNFKEDYIITWRSLTSATNRRTMLATMLPLIPTCQSIQILQIEDKVKMMHILALFNSIVFDYIVRLKMAGLDLTQTIIKQIPVPEDKDFSKRIVFGEIDASINEHINSRLYALYKNDDRVRDAFREIEWYEIHVSKERKQIIAEIDILIAMLYGMGKTELIKIAKTFGKFYTVEEVEKWF